MAESLLTSLQHTLDNDTISQIARSLGESEHSISTGMESSIASILGALAGQARDPGALRKILDLASDNHGQVSWSTLADGLSRIGSPWITEGRQMLPVLFGSGSNAAAAAVGSESGLGTGTASTLLALAAPMVLRFLRGRVREEGWSMRDLGAMLLRESPAIRSAMPAGLHSLVGPASAEFAEASSVNAPSARRERNYGGWLGAVALAVLALGLAWFWNHLRKPAANITTSGEANRVAGDAGGLRDVFKRKLPNGVELNVPAGGTEVQLLNIVSGSGSGGTPWLDFDHLTFDSASFSLRPDSTEQLNNLAAILKAYPNVRLKLGGYTDDVGPAGRNLKLSRQRAEHVKGELVARGIAAERLAAQGFGEATTDNDSDAGRARNRKVSVQVTGT